MCTLTGVVLISVGEYTDDGIGGLVGLRETSASIEVIGGQLETENILWTVPRDGDRDQGGVEASRGVY